MLTNEQNDRLCRVEGAAPMGAMIRRFWLPALRSAALEADGAPRRVTLLGKHHVAFRTTDGSVGLFDEQCPHRCASLMLARNEDNGLRCIYHGWKFSAAGSILEIPTEADPRREAALRTRAPLRHYPMHEAGGLVWVWLGEGIAPAPPAFEFTTLATDHYDLRAVHIRANWLQAMEAVLDTAHLGFLHRSSIVKAARAASQKNLAALFTNMTPRLQVERTDYGLREAAMRALPDGRVNTRIREVIAPIHVIVPGEPGADRQHVITVPVDDHHCIQYMITYNPFRPMTRNEIDTIWFDTIDNADDIAAELPGPDALWGQDRAAMKAGHFSGLLDRQSLCEDVAIVESMQPLVDRTREFLTHTDLTIVSVRRELLAALDQADRGERVWGEIDRSFHNLRSNVAMLGAGEDWRAIEAFVT